MTHGVPVENFMELLVTYNINMDFALAPQRKDEMNLSDDLSFWSISMLLKRAKSRKSRKQAAS